MAKRESSKDVPWMARQGDVLVLRDDDARGSEEIPRDPDGSVVLARGEVTGHRHRLRDANICHLRAEGVHADCVSRVTALLVESDSAELEHEEHKVTSRSGQLIGTGATPIPRGRYLIIQQEEYTPAEYRTVND